MAGLQDQPHIATRVCDAIGKLAEGFKDYAGQSSPLSPFFKEIVTVLLQAAQRSDNNHVENTRLQISAFEAINDMVGPLVWRGGCVSIVAGHTTLECAGLCLSYELSESLLFGRLQQQLGSAGCLWLRVCSALPALACMFVACVCTLQVRAASPDTLDTVGQLTPVFLQEINQTMNMAATTGEQREKQAELQGQLCGVLQVCNTNARETPVWLAVWCHSRMRVWTLAWALAALACCFDSATNTCNVSSVCIHPACRSSCRSCQRRRATRLPCCSMQTKS